MKHFIIVFFLNSIVAISSFAQVPDAKSNISSVKRDTAYIYAEATMKDLDEAMAGAKAILEVKIGDWVRSRYPDERVEVCIAKAKEHYFEVQTHRGDYNRAFVYVKKSDIMPVTNSREVMVFQMSPNDDESTPLSTADELISEDASTQYVDIPLTSDEKDMVRINSFYEIEPYIKDLKKQGRLYDYGKYASMPIDSSCYVFVYNKDGRIEAILRMTGKEQLNLRTQRDDRIKNYKNCGAIWFQIK